HRHHPHRPPPPPDPPNHPTPPKPPHRCSWPSHRRHGVTATRRGFPPTVTSSERSVVLVLTSMVDTVLLSVLATKAVLPSGVIASATGVSPTGMSVGSLVRVFTSIVDTESLPTLATKAGLAVGGDRHPVRGYADGDVGGVLRAGLDVDCRHRADRPHPLHGVRPGDDAAHARVRDKGGLAVRSDRHPF